MGASNIKGALLEYIVRKLLHDCKFTSVQPDGHYIFEDRGLFRINGKGAAHDADVAVNPPFQIPFSYPSRVLFECKAHEKTIGLDVIRNALGLRYDINEFEIITDATIEKRKNNRRATYAISNRSRYNYSVGVASVEDFSKDAFEFAANNKIPLLSLRWVFQNEVCDLFHSITQEYISRIPRNTRKKLFDFLKDKSINALNEERHAEINTFLNFDNVVGRIVHYSHDLSEVVSVGLLETGDMIFIYRNRSDFVLNHRQNLRSRIWLDMNEPDLWYIEVMEGIEYPDPNPSEFQRTYFAQGRFNDYHYKFRLPKRILLKLVKEGNNPLGLKQEFFSKIFFFNGQSDLHGLPFITFNLDLTWLNQLRSESDDHING